MSEKENHIIKETFTSAVQNHQKNNFKIAESLYEKILKINPNHLESIFLLGTLSAQTKKFDKAKQLFDKVIEKQPNHKEAHNNLGNVLKELGELQRAVNCYKEAIQISPNYADAHNNLGAVYQELGKYMEAFFSYQKSILIDPNHIKAIKNVSILSKRIYLTNVNATNSDSLKKLFLSLFRRNDIYHQDIFFNAKSVLLSSDNYNELREKANSDSLLLKNQIIKNMLKEELLLLMLQKSLITDCFMEKILVKLRHEILFDLAASNRDILKENLEFIISLAEQCFLNEYFFVQSNEEVNYINQLKKSLENNKKIDELEIAIFACYIPLHSYKIIAKKLLNYKSEKILFNDLINMQVKEPSKEKELLNSIKSLGKISDTISKKVRDQYEENPYPRWRYAYTQSPFNPLVILNAEISPNKIKFNNKFNNPNVLIAGCGTGKHILRAKDYFNANILGVDLSRASLAYAKRKTKELGLNNVEFLHADILQLNNLDKKFDIIECIGVLHHMKDPLKGLKVLLDLLEQHGFLKLGFYSQTGRQHVIRAKEFVKSNKFENTINDIRSFRQAIINEKKDQLLIKIRERNDFYSTSSVRDLIFHVQEHHFTLPMLSKILLNFNLEFLGFADLMLKSKYSNLYPNDKNNVSLDNWNQFEMDNPNTFVGMYNFWVRKIL